jgi:hypothetical protein
MAQIGLTDSGRTVENVTCEQVICLMSRIGCCLSDQLHTRQTEWTTQSTLSCNRRCGDLVCRVTTNRRRRCMEKRIICLAVCFTIFVFSSTRALTNG